MTLYELAKKAGIKQPQHLYNMFRMGYIKAERTTCGSCGHTALMVSDEEAAKYLAGRAEREAKKAAKVAAELDGTDNIAEIDEADQELVEVSE